MSIEVLHYPLDVYCLIARSDWFGVYPLLSLEHIKHEELVSFAQQTENLRSIAYSNVDTIRVAINLHLYNIIYLEICLSLDSNSPHVEAKAIDRFQ